MHIPFKRKKEKMETPLSNEFLENIFLERIRPQMMTNCMLIFFFFGLKFFFVRMTEIAFNKEMDFYF